MANLIESVIIENPSGVNDTCSHLTVVEKRNLVISECMPYIGTYAFRFWIKSNAEKTISFSCDTTFKDFNIGQDWSCIQMVFEVD